MKRYFILLSIVLLFGCKKEEVPVLGNFSLSEPENRNLCTTATSVSESKGNVLFSWQASANASDYEITVINSATNQMFSQSVTGTSATLLLDKGLAYAWYVTARNQGNALSLRSDTWSFYLERNQQTSYAPFPATLNVPSSAQVVALPADGSFVFMWTGSDLDNDIASYDFLLDNNLSDADGYVLLSSGLQATQLSVTLLPNAIYYWRVITTDNQGNKSATQKSIFRTR